MSDQKLPADTPMNTIYVMGKRYEVPAGLTIMKSMEFAGYQFTRGCGCRGGVCGACATIYRLKSETKWHIGLACQVNAENDMYLVQLPYVPAYRADYDVQTTEFSDDNVLKLYPTLKRCMGCNTCTNSCPVNLKVLDYVSAILQGEFETAVHLSMECIMCGMCAARCPAELAPMNMGMMVRRLWGKKTQITTPQLATRLKNITDGVFDAEITKYMGMDKAHLQEVFKGFQATKGEAV